MEESLEKADISVESQAPSDRIIPLTVITGNENKFREIVAILSDKNVSIFL